MADGPPARGGSKKRLETTDPIAGQLPTSVTAMFPATALACIVRPTLSLGRPSWGRIRPWRSERVTKEEAGSSRGTCSSSTDWSALQLPIVSFDCPPYQSVMARTVTLTESEEKPGRARRMVSEGKRETSATNSNFIGAIIPAIGFTCPSKNNRRPMAVPLLPMPGEYMMEVGRIPPTLCEQEILSEGSSQGVVVDQLRQFDRYPAREQVPADRADGWTAAVEVDHRTRDCETREIKLKDGVG
eukprot:758079-Hanusia_phi.AAC.3